MFSLLVLIITKKGDIQVIYFMVANEIIIFRCVVLIQHFNTFMSYFVFTLILCWLTYNNSDIV